MASVQIIRRRTKSVDSIKKITRAMELVSTAKLKKNRDRMEKMRIYFTAIKSTVAKIGKESSNVESLYLKDNNATKKVHIVISSSMGLCGGYNSNIYKLIKDSCHQDDYFITIGEKAYKYLKNRNYEIIGHSNEEEIDFAKIKDLMQIAVSLFEKGKANSINIVYTKFVNTITFKPEIIQLAPVVLEDIEEENIDTRELLFEPNVEQVLDNLIPIYLVSVLFGTYNEAKTSEHASRRYAMENATNNAQELHDDLLLEFNRARQAKITQEISEIVSGAQI